MQLQQILYVFKLTERWYLCLRKKVSLRVCLVDWSIGRLVWLVDWSTGRLVWLVSAAALRFVF